jgi:putative DNA primase/helicase
VARGVIDAFRAALRSRAIVPPDEVIADGRLHRSNAAGKNGSGDAAFVLHLDGIPAGGFENWRDGKGWQTWRFGRGVPLSAQEREDLRRRADAAREQREADSAKRHEDAAVLADRIWSSSQAAPTDHPYLIQKAVALLRSARLSGALVVPLFDFARPGKRPSVH